MAYPLRDLDAHFLKHRVEDAGPHHGKKLPDGTTQWGGFDVDVFGRVESLAEADGISFMCPKCFKDDGHSLHVYFRGKNVPSRLGRNSKGETVRWDASGTGLDDLSLQPSILIEGGCNWHGFVGYSGIPLGHAG